VQDDFQTAFWDAKKAITAAAEAAYSRHGVRAGQQFILRALWEADGRTPGELAKQLGLATPTVTRTATRMEAAGLLRRAPHPADARLVRLCLTEKGKALQETMAAEARALTARALHGLDAAARSALVEALRTVRENLR
jgi:DNA-binding MarR family transcriptional regulator